MMDSFQYMVLRLHLLCKSYLYCCYCYFCYCCVMIAYRIYLASLILGITLLCYVIVIFVIVMLLCDDCLQDISCLIAHQDHIVIHLD